VNPLACSEFEPKANFLVAVNTTRKTVERVIVGGIASFDEAESGADTSIYFQVFIHQCRPQYIAVGIAFYSASGFYAL
jgi:hypothetical protein